MVFLLDDVVPWGRTMEEYQAMFLLREEDRFKKIAGFGDGPASFNSQATRAGYSVLSFDPIYQYRREQLGQRIEEVRTTVMKQMAQNKENYVWTKIPSLEALETVRMSAMQEFLADYDQGKAEGRYIYHELPQPLPYPDQTFDLGLSSHFLLMYTGLGYDFHVQAIDEMLRVCQEVRIFPVCDLNGQSSPLIEKILTHYSSSSYSVELLTTEYEFQKGANQLLRIHR